MLLTIKRIYDKKVFWRKNLFLLSTGSASKKCMDETTRLTHEWLQYLPMKDICFEAIMLIANLLLQKPPRNSQSKDHLSALECRFELWKKGELEDLLLERETIQASLKSLRKPSSVAEISKKYLKKFKDHMSRSNVNIAMNLATNNT